MASSDNSATQKSLQGKSSKSPYAPKTEVPSLKMEMDHQEKELLDIIEGTTVAYRKKGPQIRDNENFIAPGDEYITLPQPSLLTPTHQPTPRSHLNLYQQIPSHHEQSQPPIQQFQPPLPAQTDVHRPIENAEHHQQTATSMKPAQHINPSLINRRNHWESDEITAFRPTPQPPIQSAQSHNMIVYPWDDYADLPPR
ncbi:hypothetical protein GcM3_218034 [Golovinomyces cichoracearum]|uniref:Uncharacterized protein n=1 Tax=Golovinomyces cichoracearum TaxID=62708 RepID=A0A420H7T8_9PEZI|nr:hypothetical protein GcM3_218034 [Golovinomyces cichoracearum]